jgi:hypothetical protein
MQKPDPTNLPEELLAELRARASRMGLELPAYLKFMMASQDKRLDSRFRDAVRHVFTKYPETLRKLAQ